MNCIFGTKDTTQQHIQRLGKDILWIEPDRVERKVDADGISTRLRGRINACGNLRQVLRNNGYRTGLIRITSRVCRSDASKASGCKRVRQHKVCRNHAVDGRNSAATEGRPPGRDDGAISLCRNDCRCLCRNAHIAIRRNRIILDKRPGTRTQIIADDQSTKCGCVRIRDVGADPEATQGREYVIYSGFPKCRVAVIGSAEIN